MTEIDSDDPDEKVFDKYVSTAPLHLAWPRTNNCPETLVKKLLDEGHKIKRGRFSNRENRRLEKNWHRFCRFYPDLNDPFTAFGSNGRPESQASGFSTNSSIIHKKKRRFNKLKFIFRMAYKLDRRLLCDIRSRCKRLILYPAYGFSSKLELSNEIVEGVILDLFEEKRPVSKVSSRFDLSPAVVDLIKRNPIETKKFMWKKSDDMMLEMAIERLFNNVNPRTIPIYQIDWREVEKEMLSCGYNLKKTQLYRRWIRLNKEMVNVRHKRLFESTDIDVEN